MSWRNHGLGFTMYRTNVWEEEFKGGSPLESISGPKIFSETLRLFFKTGAFSPSNDDWSDDDDCDYSEWIESIGG